MSPSENLSSLESRSPSTDIAVIGLGCMFPDAADLKEFWGNIVKGRDSIKPIPVTHWRPEDYFDSDPKKADHTYAQSGGFLRPYAFDPLKFGIAPHAIEATDTSQLLGMVCAHEALIDAGYGPDKAFNRDKTSCIIGVTGSLELVIPLGARLGHPAWKRALKNAGVADAVAAQVIQEIADSYVPWQENSFPGLLGNVVAGRIASRLDLGGSNAVVDAACASSLAALHMATMELESGRADMVITGGIDTFNDIFMYMCFSKTPALSPTGHSRPFDAEGDGTSIGEGLGAIILKRRVDAERDGDRIYAVIKGLGSGSDGKGQAIYAPAAKGQVKALSRAYATAGIDSSTIELVEAHGTGTRVGDGVELEALAQVYGETEAKHCVIGSVKSQIGHTKAAAGAAGLIKAVMALYNKIQPPTLKIRTLHPTLAKTPFLVLDQARPWITRGDYPRRAAVSAFGFGGSNFHCVLEEHSKTDKPVVWDDETILFTWSGSDRNELLAAFEASFQLIKAGDLDVVNIAARQSRRNFQAKAQERLSVWAQGLEQLIQRCQSSRTLLQQGGVFSGVAYSNAKAQSDLAMVFAGQGSQAPGMLRDLMLAFPETLACLELGSRILSEHETIDGYSPSLMDYIYPPQSFHEDERKNQRQALTATRIAQLALGTLGAAVLMILKRFGVKATSVAGHSYGELLALYAAGVMKLEDLLRASYQRGLLMEKAGRTGGGMLAVMADAERIQQILVAEGFQAKIANYNAPQQVVVGGAIGELEKLKLILRGLKITAKSLEVSTAFHTDYVSDASAAFDKWLAEHVKFQAPTIPVYSNMLAEPYPLEKSRETLSGQLGAPVHFHAMLQAIREKNQATLIEVGPGSKILGLLKVSDSQALTLDSDSKNGLLGLSALLGELSVQGHSLDLTQWHPGREDMPSPAKKSFTVTLTGANYRSKISTPSPAVAFIGSNPEAESKLSRAFEEEVSTPPKPSTPNIKPVASALVSPMVTASLIPTANVSKPLSSALHYPVKNEVSMSSKNNQDWSNLEHILKDMQEAQRKTTDAHTLFLENQRQFQQILREALLGGGRNSEASSVSVISHVPSTPLPSPSPAVSQLPTRSHAKRPEVEISRPTAPAQKAPLKAGPSPVVPVSRPHESVRSASVADASRAQDAAAAIMKIIGEATGFPVEMLNADMHLENDLGIDSIKKVEIFSQLQVAHPGLAADADRMNGTQTIAELIAYVAPHESSAAIDREAETSVEERQGAWSASPIAFVAGKASEVKHIILSIISEKTGFPVEMLGDEMDFESDLGVDSIKKVEIFSQLQEKFPHVPFQAEALNELHKISDIMDRIQGQGRWSGAQVVDKSPDAAPNDLQAILWDVIAEKTGYPAEVLSLGMDLESDLGIDSIKRVEILSALTERLPRIKDHATAAIGTVEDLLRFLQGGAERTADDEGLAASLLNPEPMEWDLSSKKKPQIDESLIFETTVDLDSKISCWKLKAVPWAGFDPAREIRTHGDIWIIDDGSSLAQSLCHQLLERGCQAKLVALSSSESLALPDELQGLYILSPAQFDQQAQRWLKNSYKVLRRCAESLQKSQGFVVTVSSHGGQFGLDGLEQLAQTYAGGTTAFIKTIAVEWLGVHARAIDMGLDFSDSLEAARRCLLASMLQGPLEIGVQRDRMFTLKLEEESFSDQSPQKILKPGDTVLVTGGARGVTAATLIALAKRYPVRFVIWGRTPLGAPEARETKDLTDAAAIKRQLLYLQPELSHPKDLEKAYGHLLAQRETLATFSALRSYGAEVIYQVVDVSHDADMRLAMQKLSENYPSIAGVIHGAGVIRDKLIVDQNEEELLEVLDTKLRILPFLEQLAEQGVAWMILFSSSTARLGRKGQGAYCLANEILNRAASYLSTRYNCRTLALNWGPWDGGMVHEGLKKLFSSEGLSTIPLTRGAALQTYLLEHPSLGSGEWLILGEGGREILGDQIVKQERVLAQRTITIQGTPVLLDHVIKNRAVVPAALLAEWMIEAASIYFPGLVLKEISEFQVWKGLVLDSDTRLPIEIIAVNQVDMSMECVLRSRTPDGQLRPHAHARLHFADNFLKTGARRDELEVDASLIEIKPYEAVLFHGESLQYIESILYNTEGRCAFALNLFGEANDWDHGQKLWFAQAPLLDAVFQGAIVWSSLNRNSRCLPSKFKKAVYYQDWEAQKAILDIEVLSSSDHRLLINARVWTLEGRLIAEVLEFEATLDASLAESFALKSLLPIGRDVFNV